MLILPHYDTSLCLSLLLGGKVGAIPTDTVAGLFCNPFNATAVERVFQIKKRDLHKPFAFFLPTIEAIENHYYKLSLQQFSFLEQILPGSVTVVLPLDNKAISPLIHDGYVGIRITKHAFCQKLLSYTNQPLAATSLNISSFPEVDISLILTKKHQLSYDIDFAVQEKEINTGKPSTVILLQKHSVKILREGAIPSQEIKNLADQYGFCVVEASSIL